MTDAGRALTLVRTLEAPRAAVWRCWSEPDLLMRWFCPKPWTVSEARMDLRPGGEFFTRMRGPAGEDVPGPGVFLEVVPGERLVFTDAYVRAWEPAEKPFFTGVVAFADAGPGRTRYDASALHWTEDARKAHEEMGFHQGWNAAADQLEALARTLGSGHG